MLYCRYHLNKRQIFNLIFVCVKMYSTLLVENRIFRFVCVNDIFNYMLKCQIENIWPQTYKLRCISLMAWVEEKDNADNHFTQIFSSLCPE